MRVGFLMGLVGCAPPTQIAQSPPPTPLGLTLQLRDDEVVLSGARAGESLVLLGADALGDDLCPPILGGTCLGLAPQPGGLARLHAVADAAGQARWQLPNQGQPGELWLQAAETSGRAVSNVVDATALRCRNILTDQTAVAPGLWQDLPLCGESTTHFEVPPGKVGWVRSTGAVSLIGGGQYYGGFGWFGWFGGHPNTDGTVLSWHNDAPDAAAFVVTVTPRDGPTTHDLEFLLTDPGACVDDALEPDNTRATAVPFTATSAQRRGCHGDEDWFAITLEPASTLHAEIRQEPVAGRANMTLFADDGETVMATSLRGVLSYTSLNGGPAYMRVDHADLNGPGFDYTLLQDFVPLGCVDDSVHDTQASALPLAETQTGTVCPDQRDLWWVDLAAGEEFHFRAVAETQGLAEVTAKAPDAEDFAGQGWSRVTAAVDGRVYVRVESHNTVGAHDYVLETRRVPAHCEPDAFEPDDRVSAAHPLTPSSPRVGRLCPGDRDTFLIDLHAGEEGRPQLEFLEPFGLARWTLTDLAGNLIPSQRAQQDGPHYLLVEAEQPPVDGVAYVISVAADTCVNDAYEHNDDITPPAVLTPPIDAIACGYDDDRYFLDAPPDSWVTVSTTPLMEVLVREQGERVWNDNNLPYAISDGPLEVMVSGYFGSQPYTIDLSSTPYPSCSDDLLEPNDTWDSALDLTQTVAGVACHGNPDWYRFTVPEGEIATVQITGEVDVEVYDRDDLTRPEYGRAFLPWDRGVGPHRGSSWNDDFRVRVRPRADAVSPAYTLSLQRAAAPPLPADPWEPNDTRITATRLGPVATRRAYFGPDDLQDRYEVYLEAGESWTVLMRGLDHASGLSLALHNPGWDELAFAPSSGFSMLQHTAQTAGLHRIIVRSEVTYLGGASYLLESRVEP